MRSRWHSARSPLLVPAGLTLLLGMVISSAIGDEPFLVIAHRGASGYLPEHTLAAVSLAYGMGAHFIEQDVVLTNDDQPVVLHDIHLDAVTDVAERFPNRSRRDGRYYALDFTLAEIRTLRVNERIDPLRGGGVFPNRFPQGKSRFYVPTLAEEIELIQGLNRTTGRNVGIYPEIKQPAWHREQGRDIGAIVLATLSRYGYTRSSDRVFVQCFDPAELKLLREQHGIQLQLVQLIGQGQAELLTSAGLQTVATYANGVGPSIGQIMDREGELNLPMIQQIKQAGLALHPYTFRADSLPPGIESLRELMSKSVHAGIHGAFTDHPDQCVKWSQTTDRGER